MPRLNRVDPFGDLHADPARGLFTGNRGCLYVDGRLTLHHRGSLWITCVTEFRGRWNDVARTQRWTPLFLLDDAVALAAGHRPCGECRHAAYLAYREAVAEAVGRPIRVAELDRGLNAQRLHRGRGLSRAGDRRTWEASAEGLPDGTVVVLDGLPRLLAAERLLRFTFAGWTDPVPCPDGPLTVLTPPMSVTALAHGFSPVLHPSAGPVA